jgi:rubrerythrin
MSEVTTKPAQSSSSATEHVKERVGEGAQQIQDVDGAIQETADALDPFTRASFLRKAGIGVGAVVGGSALLGGLPATASAAVPASDIAILNFALTLEYLEAEFYAQAVSKGNFSGETRLFADKVAAHEAAHVAFLRKTLGRKAVRKPRFDFQDTVTNVAKFQATATVLEDTGVAAYLGQVGNIRNKTVLKAAGSILSVEARHAAWIREIRGRGGAPVPAPAAFEVSKTKRQILAAVKGTGFIVG